MSEWNAASGAVPSVCCVIVNWNGYADTLACLESLAQQDYPNLRTVVVDNGSTNDSVARIRAAFPHILLIETGKNLGFPSGCNVGMRQSAAQGDDFVWLLNNDTVVGPDTCSKLVRKALATPGAGLIGSVLNYMHDPAHVQAWGGGNINVLLGRSTHFHAPAPFGPRSYMTFASALLPGEVMHKVGILYEGFFMYWDDADLALRLTRAGYGMTVAEDTHILHKEGGSSAPKSPVIDRYAAAAGLHFLRRHSPVPLFSQIWFIAIRLLARTARRQPQNVRAVWLAVGDYLHQRKQTFTDQL